MAGKGTCPFCLAENVKLTVEHVLPESWYPDGHPPSKMLTVPACGPCNAAHDKFEKKLFLPFALSLPDDPRVASIVERAMRSADPAAGKSPRDTEHRQARGASLMRRTSILLPDQDIEAIRTPMGRPLAEYVTESGLHVRGTPAVNYGWENLEAVAIKFLRGVFFDRTKTPLGTAKPCWARTFVDVDPQPLVDEWKRLPMCQTAGEFPFWSALAIDERGRGAGAMFVLWDHITLFASNLPRRADK